MSRLRIWFLFTSLDKCSGDGIFSSDNETCIFWGYIGVDTMLVDLFEWSSSVGFSVAQIKMIRKQIQYDKENYEINCELI